MSPQELLKIIDRLQELEGPDREVDGWIAQGFLGGTIMDAVANFTMEPYQYRAQPSKDHVRGYSQEPILRYTGDVTSALTLAPENAEYTVRKFIHVSQDGTTTDVFWQATVGTGFIRKVRSGPAIAVCIAAIRDRIASGK